jgi:hypothetical protein
MLLEEENGRAGAEEDIRSACPGTTTQKCFYDFTHVQVWRQPHLGQHLHVPLSQADMVTDEFRELNKERSKTLVGQDTG